MAALSILKMGTPSLWERSKEITEFSTKNLCQLIQDLKDAMDTHKGVGIAAPQIGINQRIILLGFEKNPRYPNEKPVQLTALINPSWEPITDEKVEDWEGCLSIPGLRGKVPRYAKIRYTGFNEQGKIIEKIAEGFHARIIQDECDHLDGILYPERIENKHNFGFEDILWETIYR